MRILQKKMPDPDTIVKNHIDEMGRFKEFFPEFEEMSKEEKQKEILIRTVEEVEASLQSLTAYDLYEMSILDLEKMLCLRLIAQYTVEIKLKQWRNELKEKNKVEILKRLKWLGVTPPEDRPDGEELLAKYPTKNELLDKQDFGPENEKLQKLMDQFFEKGELTREQMVESGFPMSKKRFTVDDDEPDTPTTSISKIPEEEELPVEHGKDSHLIMKNIGPKKSVGKQRRRSRVKYALLNY